MRACAPSRKSTPNDFRQLAALRRDARADDPAALREVARQFESIFTKMMLDSMRAASFGDPMFGSDQGDMYQGMMDDQLAVEMSQGRGIGLADMLIRQLQPGRATARAARRPPERRRRANSTSSSRRCCRMPRRRRASSASIRARSSRRRRSRPVGHLATGRCGGASHNLFGIKAGGQWQGASVRRYHRIRVGIAAREARVSRLRASRKSVADYVRVFATTRVTRRRSTRRRRARVRDRAADAVATPPTRNMPTSWSRSHSGCRLPADVTRLKPTRGRR
jgi:flagellar protein FlgJ